MRPQEAGHRAAGVLVGLGRPRRQLVCGAVDIGVLVAVELGQALDDRIRLLGRGGIIEPDQRPAVDPLVQDGEVAADRPDIEPGMRLANEGPEGALVRCCCVGVQEVEERGLLSSRRPLRRPRRRLSDPGQPVPEHILLRQPVGARGQKAWKGARRTGQIATRGLGREGPWRQVVR
jgi:hypothetical protein